MTVLKLLAAGAAGYVAMRAAWIFLGWPGVVAVVVLVVALFAWRRQWPLAVGAATGAALSAIVLSF